MAPIRARGPLLRRCRFAIDWLGFMPLRTHPVQLVIDFWTHLQSHAQRRDFESLQQLGVACTPRCSLHASLSALRLSQFDLSRHISMALQLSLDTVDRDGGTFKHDKA